MSAFVLELFHIGLYKRNQGRVARQATFAVLAIAIGVGTWSMSQSIAGDMLYRFAIPGLLLALGLWSSYRLVNLPAFADFLISVEGEMNKVSWPSRSDLFRGSMVVMFTIFFLALVLYLYDLFWQQLLKMLNVIN